MKSLSVLLIQTRAQFIWKDLKLFETKEFQVEVEESYLPWQQKYFRFIEIKTMHFEGEDQTPSSIFTRFQLHPFLEKDLQSKK